MVYNGYDQLVLGTATKEKLPYDQGVYIAGSINSLGMLCFGNWYGVIAAVVIVVV